MSAHKVKLTSGPPWAPKEDHSELEVSYAQCGKRHFFIAQMPTLTAITEIASNGGNVEGGFFAMVPNKNAVEAAIAQECS